MYGNAEMIDGLRKAFLFMAVMFPLFYLIVRLYTTLWFFEVMIICRVFGETWIGTPYIVSWVVCVFCAIVVTIDITNRITKYILDRKYKEYEFPGGKRYNGGSHYFGGSIDFI